MTTTEKNPILVAVQLTGGNDHMNTVIPFNDPLYWDNRSSVGVPQEQVPAIDDQLGSNLALAHYVAERVVLRTKDVR